jgi:large subunit ribosomal protein L18
VSAKTSPQGRVRRHLRVRRKISGTSARPRLAVFRSNSHIYAQLIDDSTGRTVASASTMADGKNGDKSESARNVGRLVAERAVQAGFSTAVFDRGGFKYHGRIAAVADAARQAGLKF